MLLLPCTAALKKNYPVNTAEAKKPWARAGSSEGGEETATDTIRTVTMTDVQVQEIKQNFRVPGFTTENEVLNEPGLVFSLVLQHSEVLLGSRGQVHITGCRQR